ncbi:MAG: hypothetical protein R8M38_08230 [Mariprofundaceae bacterium]
MITLSNVYLAEMLRFAKTMAGLESDTLYQSRLVSFIPDVAGACIS